MKDNDTYDLSWDEWDELQRPAPQTTDFEEVVDEVMTRRGFLGSIVALGSGAAVMGTGILSGTSAEAQAASRFGFTPIPIATDSTIHVPDGYGWQSVAKWGEPLFGDAEELSQETAVSVASSDRVFGENTDGMEAFVVDGRQVIAVNHEYVNTKINLPQNPDGAVLSADDVKTLQNMQGVTVMEVAEGEDGWAIVVDSDLNRRITQNTPMVLTGPAAGHALLQTEADPEGRVVLGTLNNCGAGKTPWGTYLTCEENFNGYFGSTDEGADVPADYARYGIGAEGRYAYEKFDARFDTSKNPHEPHRFGYIVEIDPTDPNATPIKHTALGRFKHENAAAVIAPDGRVVVYMGDDERGEFMYKYVSNGVYTPGGPTSELLDDGQLFAAKFNTDGRGEWIALTPEATGMDAAEIAIFTRRAASAVGATTMDRPEWVAVNPVSVEGYCALTNNSRRAADFTNKGGDAAFAVAGSPNPRNENRYGQIVRWRPENDDHAAVDFTWDLYVMAGNPTVHDDLNAGSENVNEGNLFNSPDGMMFDSTGLLWIQTDGDDSNEDGFAGMGNNQMLAGDPVTGQIERFMTGPNGSEVTGLTWSADKRTMFVGIQHPDAPFPDGEGMLARSSIVAIKRDDNLPVG